MDKSFNLGPANDLLLGLSVAQAGGLATESALSPTLKSIALAPLGVPRATDGNCPTRRVIRPVSRHRTPHHCDGYIPHLRLMMLEKLSA